MFEATESMSRNISERDISQPELTEPQEFCEMLIRFLRPFVEDLGSTDEIECIQLSLQRFAPYLHRKDLGDIYMEFVFSLFEKFRTTNSDLIQNSLEEFVERMEYESIQPPLILTRAQRIPHDVFTGFSDDLTMERTALSIMYFSHNAMFVKRLLRYGVRIIHDYDDVLSNLMFIDKIAMLENHESTGHHFWQLRHKCSVKYSAPRDKRRLPYVFLAALIGLTKRRKIFEECSKTLGLLYKTITEPLITVEEILSLLDTVIVCEDKEAFITEACETFREEFPKSKDPLQPRTLMHLCRCSLRESLRQKKKLPHGVWKLPLPKILQNYVLIQKREDEFYPEYVSALSGEKSPPSNS